MTIWVLLYAYCNATDTDLYGVPQQSQQQQITHSTNELITMITKTSHQNQIAEQHKQDAHSTSENSHSTNKNFHSTNENSHSTTKARRSIVPLSRFEEIGNHLPVDISWSSWLPDERSYSIFLEKFRIRGRGKSEWILDTFNKVFILDFYLSFYLRHDN